MKIKQMMKIRMHLMIKNQMALRHNENIEGYV
jgi:hypothetical protein